jgi:acetyl esterase/lipase
MARRGTGGDAGAIRGDGTVTAAAFDDGMEIRLWPGVAPGSEGVAIVEETIARDDGTGLPDRVWEKILVPTLIVVRPERANGAAIVLVPGGGYIRVVNDKEGGDLGRRLAEVGYTVFILKYRLPGDGHALRADLPLVDAQRALRTVRANAAAWGLDPARIGVFGASAGGHLAAMLSTRFAETPIPPRDAVDHIDARPAFAVLLYPVITMAAGVTHAGSRGRLLGDAPDAAAVAAASLETRVTPATPPTFLVHAGDDAAVPVENSLRYCAALQKAGVAAELHVYPESGHGFGLRFMKGTAVGWFDAALAWLKATA